MKIDLSVSKYWEHVDIDKIEKQYDCKFVCESAIRVRNSWRESPSLIFYSQEPHPEGSNYMAFSYDFNKDCYVVSDGISVTEVEFSGIVANNDDVIYSRYRHDYRLSSDKSVWIDGGRDYHRSCSGFTVYMKIINGELTIIEETNNVLDVEEEKEDVTWHKANGVKGCLLRLMTNPETYVFRVYDDEYGFIDYDISHHDLDLVINDDTAAFCKINGKYYLDYIPEVLEGC
jgi:hypothetical protein